VAAAADQDDDEDDAHAVALGSQRLDKWLWFARVLKSRTLAATAIAEGRVRVNRIKITKPAQSVKAGDVLTIALREKVLVLRLLAPGQRRGPPPEARLLYEDLTPPPVPRPDEAAHGERERGSGRPSKRDRRLIDRLKGGR
jgi:ribosome-associated heat shock protein Hsp15